LLDEYGISFEGNGRIFVDGANSSFIYAFKDKIDGEDPDYDRVVSYLKTNYGHNFSLQSFIHNMFVVSIAFNREHKSMLSHSKQIMEHDNGRVAIILP
jgi:hypothetical protein